MSGPQTEIFSLRRPGHGPNPRAGLAGDGYPVGATTLLDILNPEAAPGDLTVAAEG